MFFQVAYIMINLKSFRSEVSDDQNGRFGGTFLSQISHSSAGSHQICMDWQARESHVGGKKYKQCFVQRLFDTMPMHQPLQSNGSPEQ